MNVFTDHRNLLYLFAPLALRPNSPRHVLSKVHRWAIHLSQIEFFIDHIENANKVFADILTRWPKEYRVALTQRFDALYMGIVPSAHGMEAIAVEGIISEQQKHHSSDKVQKDDDEVYKKEQQT